MVAALPFPLFLLVVLFFSSFRALVVSERQDDTWRMGLDVAKTKTEVRIQKKEVQNDGAVMGFHCLHVDQRQLWVAVLCLSMLQPMLMAHGLGL
jgi:hypothetical protein